MRYERTGYYDENINVQCVYGDKNIEHIMKCIIPNLAMTTKKNIFFLTMNYKKHGKRIASGKMHNITVVDIEKDENRPTGFAENHNILFEHFTKTSSFVLMNPDCIPLPQSIDCLLNRKTDEVAIVEGRQWPFEHPKEYDPLSLETPWASGAFALIDSCFYEKVNGMDPLYFLYNEDVDLSWRAWLNGYRVLYEPSAQIIHFTNGYFENKTILSTEKYFSLRNFILISRKFFGKEGEYKAIEMLRTSIEKNIFNLILNDYNNNIVNSIQEYYYGKYNKHIKILGINLFAETGERV